MTEGALILKMIGTNYYSPVIARQTMHAIFVAQVTNCGGGGTITVNVDVQHRNRSDTSWTSAGTFTAITADGIYTKELSGLKELVRYAFNISGAGTSSYSGAQVFGGAPSWLID